MISIENIINKINTLPTLPTVYSKLTEAIEDPNNTVDQISKIISADQASVFKILKVVNSPFYGFRGKIDTISQAIFYLGFNEVRNIVLALSVINMFSKESALRDYSPVDLWSHSIGVGILARAIGASVNEKNLENYFVAGIFHDIGKLIFMEYAPEEYQKVFDLLKVRKITISDAETEVFGADHSIAGSLLAEKWKLPPSIQKTVRYHHILNGNELNNILLGSIYIADIYANAMELGFDGSSIISQPNNVVWNTVKLKPGYIKSISKKLREDYNHTIKIILVD
ncbi:MAG: HDOD domain-containing protein [Ignavibacteriales bacterium]|nr:HDOD domain-containing protein [Ignavibacteriales bacterium]